MLVLAPVAFAALALSPLLPTPTPEPTGAGGPVPGTADGNGCQLQAPRPTRTQLTYLNGSRVSFVDTTGGVMGSQQAQRWEVQQPPQRPLVKVAFYIDGEERLTVTKPDADGTLALETPPGYFTAGSHQVGARLFGLNGEAVDDSFDVDVTACSITEATASVARRPKQIARFTWTSASDPLSTEPDIIKVAIKVTAGALLVFPSHAGASLGTLHVTGAGRPPLDIRLKQPRRGTVLGSSGAARVTLQPSARTITVTGLPAGSTAGTLELTRGAVRGIGRCWTAAFGVFVRGTTGAVTIPVTDRRRCR